jgi:Fur family transcriptional regulator, zinc uptake regulator
MIEIAMSKKTRSTRNSALRASAARWRAEVESACEHKGLLLTPLRHQVLAILAESSAPLGAYAIIDQLSRREGKPIAPPTVYRTLDFFLENGFVYKIESRNAYAPCEHLGHAHHGALLLCEKCGRSDEIEDVKLDGLLQEAAARAGFSPHRQMVELVGLCRDCTAQSGDRAAAVSATTL